MTRHLLALLAGSLLLLLAAPSAHALEVVASQSDTGRAVVLQRGDRLRISLEENPSTGFAWRTVRAPSKDVLTRRSNRFVGPAEPLPGAPGRREIAYRAVGRGTTRITLRLVGPGSDAEVGRTFRLSITVR